MASTYNVSPAVWEAQWQKKVKTATIRLDSTDTSKFLTGIASAETVSLFKLPAGSQVLSSQIKVITGETGITDVDLGLSTDGSTNASLIDGATIAVSGTFVAKQTAVVPVNTEKYLVFTLKAASQVMNEAVIDISVTYVTA